MVAMVFPPSAIVRCCVKKLAPREGLEPPTKWLQVSLAFLPGLDYLFTHLSAVEKDGCRALSRFIGRGPQPLVSARSCLPFPIRQASLRVTIQASGVFLLRVP